MRKAKRYPSALRALLVTAVWLGLALGVVSARAAVVTPLQLPGQGYVAFGSSGLFAGPITHGTETIALSAFPTTGSIAGYTVISWGAHPGSPGYYSGIINPGQPAGFNIGGSAALHFVTPQTGPFHIAGVLNVDVSGNLSQILGALTGGPNVSIFVANANGITVGPKATLTAPAGLGLIAASVNTPQTFLAGGPYPVPFGAGDIPVSFAHSGPLTVQGNLQGVGGFVLLAGSGAVNVSPIQGVSGTTFATNNVTVVGGVGGAFLMDQYYIYPTPNVIPMYLPLNTLTGYLTPSATAPTTVTLNLGTAAHPYTVADFLVRGTVEGSLTSVYVLGNIVNNGVLGGVSNAVMNLQWTGTLTNNGTIHFELDSSGILGGVSFLNKALSAPLAFGGLVNNGTISTNSSSPLNIDLPGTIINNAGATISNAGGSVHLYAGNVGSILAFTGVGGAVINHGSVIAYRSVDLVASNSNQTGPNPGGGVFSNGSIRILSPTADRGSSLIVESLTGNAFLGGTVTTPKDSVGLMGVTFQSGANLGNLFTLGTNITAGSVSFSGGSLRGSGTLTTADLHLSDFTGNVNNVTSPTNYLANGFHVANGSFGNTYVTISLPTNPQGAIGRQAINLNVKGNAAITSGTTSAIGAASTFVSGLGPVGILPTEANAGSNLLVHASGNLTVNPSRVVLPSASPRPDPVGILSTEANVRSNSRLDPGMVGTANYTLSGVAPSASDFAFPGGIVLIAGKTLTLNTLVDNGYAPTVAAG